MIKVAEIIKQHKEGKVPASTMIKMAAFKQELEKSADFFSNVGKIMQQQAPSVAAGAATMGLGALIFEGIRGLEKAWTGYKLDATKEPKFLDMLAMHPELKSDKETRERASLYFDSLWHFSPSMAQDPLAAGAYIKQALQMHHVAQGPIPELVSRTTEIQKNVLQGTKDHEYATPMGAVFLGLKPQPSAAFGKMPSPISKNYNKKIYQRPGASNKTIFSTGRTS